MSEFLIGGLFACKLCLCVCVCACVCVCVFVLSCAFVPSKEIRFFVDEGGYL